MQILLALDGSAESLEAANFLARLPLPSNSRVTVVSVIVDTNYDVVQSESQLQLRQAERIAAEQHYTTASRVLSQSGYTCEHIIREGHPNALLIALAKERNVDLISLGARGHSLFARALLGSTSDYVANHARCPVLIARPSAAKNATQNALRILLAYDGTPGAKLAADQMFSLAWTPETQVQITTLLERPGLLPEDEVYDPEAIQQTEAKLTELVAAAACKANVSFKVRETVHVGSALSTLAEKEAGDLIFVGETGKSAIAQFFLGSAARHVLHHSPCSVWVARAKRWNA